MFVQRPILCLILASTCFMAYADEVEFPEEELASESVLPVFSNRRDVLNRHIVTAQRFEVGGGAGLEIDEPFYNDIIFGAHVGYHFTDQHAFNVEGIFWLPGLSSYGQKLKDDSSLINHWDAGKAPHPLWGFMGNYEFTAYYGKISITKNVVMNLNLFGFVGGLYINMKNANGFGGDFGIGQNFFISKNLAIRFTIGMLIFSGPNPASANLSSTAGINQNPQPSDFESKIFYNNQMNLQFVVLL